MTLSQRLADVLAKFESKQQVEQFEIRSTLEAIKKDNKDHGEAIEDALRFELIAVHLDPAEEPGAWDTFYGPELSAIDQQGERHDSPPLNAITPECISYWSNRMVAAQNPVLRARYADLVWDLSYKATGKRANIAAAQVAVDGYVAALAVLQDPELAGWGNIAKRALELSLSIKDSTRLQMAIAACIEQASAVVDGVEKEQRQLDIFRLLKAIPAKLQPTTELQTLVTTFRERLETMDKEQADQFAIDRYAIPLAEHYRSTKQSEDTQAVLRIYGAAVERMANKTTMAILAVGWLKQLHELYVAYGMNDDAKRILTRIEEHQPRVTSDLVPISSTQEISNEELEGWLNEIVTNDFEESITNVIVHFVPRLDEVRRLRDSLKKQFPLSQIFTSTLVDQGGRDIAEIGPDDDEGTLIRQVSQHLSFRSIFLELGLKRLFGKHALGANELFDYLIQSPIFHEKRHAVLRRGVEAYFAEDHITAVHLLVTEIENAIRVLASGLGAPMQKRNRIGGFDVRNLGDFLADKEIEGFLAEDILMYLKIVLVERRGWNLRNNTCHGILESDGFSSRTAQQLIHVLMLLSTIRRSSST